LLMNVKRWNDNTKCQEKATELALGGSRNGFAAIPLCLEHKAVSDRWIANNLDINMFARIMKGEFENGMV
jgi:hypothetical protein